MESPEIRVGPRGFSSTSLLSFYLFYHNFFALLVLCLTVFPYIGYAVFFYSFTLFIAAVFVCRQVLKENLLEGDRVCTSSDCINA